MHKSSLLTFQIGQRSPVFPAAFITVEHFVRGKAMHIAQIPTYRLQEWESSGYVEMSLLLHFHLSL
ncbi:hypothetical protein B27N_03071 [Alcanivorax marinus]|nr:hypothetical protein [Alloalcanivorax marinus]